MRIAFVLATLVTAATAIPAAAQQRSSTGFSFDTCFNQCLTRGGSPGSCQTGCADRAATLSNIPAGARRNPNDDPRSPRFHDPEPRKGFN